MALFHKTTNPNLLLRAENIEIGILRNIVHKKTNCAICVAETST